MRPYLPVLNPVAVIPIVSPTPLKQENAI